MNIELLRKIENLVGDSFFVYDGEIFKQNLCNFHNAFKTKYNNISLGYSFKTNYFQPVIETVKESGHYAEVVSGMEYEIALENGFEGSSIIFNGPYKTTTEILKAVQGGSIIHFDSMDEITRTINELDKYPNLKVFCSLRCNIDIGEEQLSRFGMDEETLLKGHHLLSQKHNFELVGIHVHISTRHRSVESYTKRTSEIIRIVKTVFTHKLPNYIDIGGGFYGSIPLNLQNILKISPPNYHDYAESITSLMKSAFPDESVKLIIEPGAAVVADSFKFYCKVHSIKSIRGKQIITTTGSLNNIQPTGVTKISLPFKRYSEGLNEFDIKEGLIAGYTCMEHDILNKSYTGKIALNDYLEYNNMGAYTLVFKPPFIKPSPAIVTINNGEISVLRINEKPSELFLSKKSTQ